jgi:hypothetical protein
LKSWLIHEATAMTSIAPAPPGTGAAMNAAAQQPRGVSFVLQGPAPREALCRHVQRLPQFARNREFRKIAEYCQAAARRML